MQKQGYRIHFVSGELSGRSFVIPPEGLLIGKSRSAAIRPGTSDIKIEHASLCFRGDDLFLEPRADAVFAGNRRLTPGEPFRLDIGSDVRLGWELSFIVESDEGIPSSAAPDGEEETVDEATEGTEAPASGRQTRYASEMELKDLRAFARRQTRRKRFYLAAGVTVFLLLIVGGFLYSELYQENPVTWPGELSGQFNDGEFRIELDPAGKFMIYYPQCKMTKKQADGNNCEVMTLLGKNLDVPFHIRLIVNTVPDGFVTTRKQSFDQWRTHASEKEGFSFLSLPEENFYAMDSCGYPYYSIDYKRAAGKLHWQGFASYLRYHDKEIILLREVPLHHFWRTEKVLSQYNCFVVSPDATASYWEIPEKIPDQISRTSLYKVLLENMRGNLIACNWKDMKDRFALLLSSSGKEKDAGMMRDALSLWREFRDNQQFWYCQACLAYQMYDLRNDSGNKYSIVTECLRKFPTPDDYRHIRITKNIWTIEL